MPALIKCKACQGTVYPMDQISVDGVPFHKLCLKCSVCQRILSLGQYASLNGQYFCKPHFKQSFKTKGNYKFTDASAPEENQETGPEPVSEAVSEPTQEPELVSSPTKPNDQSDTTCPTDKDAC